MRLRIEGGPSDVSLTSLEGVEQLGAPFQYRLRARSASPSLVAQDLLNRDASVRLELGDPSERYLHGIITRASRETPERGGCWITLTLSPRLWLLGRASDCRVFQDRTVVEIALELLREHAITDVDLRLDDTYPKLEYCVQYRETHLNFFSRLLEDAGIYYYFEHSRDKHTLVLCDGSRPHPSCPGYEMLEFQVSDAGAREVVDAFVEDREIAPTVIARSTFDPERRRDPDAARSPLNEAAPSELEIFDYFDTPYAQVLVDDVARVRGEEVEARLATHTGHTNARGLRAGHTCTIEFPSSGGRPFEGLLTGVEIRAEAALDGSPSIAEDWLECTFSMLPVRQRFRPARRTPLPIVQGSQTAIVSGEGESGLCTDELGRVRVWFPWDRKPENPQKTSCWVRVGQSWASRGWGALLTPRIGDEVIVQFLEGHPDRPLIVGRVYNAANRPPYRPKDFPTISTFKSKSDGAEGFNEIRFDDKGGDEQFFMHAQRNFDLRVVNDCFEWVGGEQHSIVKKSRFDHVEGWRHERTDADARLEVGQDLHLSIEGKCVASIGGSASVSIGGDATRAVKGQDCLDAGTRATIVAGEIVLEARDAISLKCAGSSIVIDAGGVTATGPIVTLDGQQTLINSGPGAPPLTATPARVINATKPDDALEADNANPGQLAELKLAQRTAGLGKHGRTVPTPFRPDPEKTGWIEIVLLDEIDEPVPGERYRITLPDGRVAEGILDENGFARVEGFDPGECEVTFPALDRRAWSPVDTGTSLPNEPSGGARA